MLGHDETQIQYLLAKQHATQELCGEQREKYLDEALGLVRKKRKKSCGDVHISKGEPTTSARELSGESGRICPREALRHLLGLKPSSCFLIAFLRPPPLGRVALAFNSRHDVNPWIKRNRATNITTTILNLCCCCCCFLLFLT